MQVSSEQALHPGQAVPVAARPAQRRSFAALAGLRLETYLVSGALNILALALPIVVLQVYDRVIPNEAASTLSVLVLSLGAVMLIDALLSLGRAHITGWAGARAQHRLACEAFWRLLHADLGAYDKLGFATVTVTPRRELLEPKYGEDYPRLVAALEAMDGQAVLGSVNSGAPIFAGGILVLPDELEVEVREIPLLTQYLQWMWNSTRFEFGNSLKVNRPVVDEWLRFFPVTASIVVLAAIMTVIAALPIGIISAVRQDKFADYVGRIISIAGLSLPSFWVALLIILGMVIWFGWLPPLEYVPVWEAPWQSFQHMFFPAFAVAFSQIGIIARMTRSSMLEVLREDYVRTAWSKGLSEQTVVMRHALKNAFLPVLTVFGLQFGFAIGGLVVVERAFNLPGLGNFLVDSVVFRDYNSIQATLFATAIFVTLANLLVDLAYAWFNPRIRYA